LSAAPRPGAFECDRWQVLQLVKDTARATGIGEREIAVLSAHLSVLPRGPVRASDLLISFAEIGGILDRANCMDERRFRRGEARLAELGFVARKLSGNGRRYPVRDGRGQIVDAYGLDLRPLFLRLAELEALRTALAEEEAARRALRSRISARLSALRRDMEARGGALPAPLAELVSGLARLIRRARVALPELLAAETTLLAQLSTVLAATPEPGPAMTAEVGISPDKSAADAGQIVRRMESLGKENIASSGLPADIPRLWRVCPRIAAYFPDPPRHAHDLHRIGQDFLGFIGLRDREALDILTAHPLADLLRMLEYLTGRLAQLGNPKVYFLSMLRAYDRGEAVAGGQIRRSSPIMTAVITHRAMAL